MRRLVFLAWAMLAGLAGCARPPASAYLSARSGFEAPQIALGRDSGGEACAAARTKNGALIYCGAWRQPSARVTAGPRAGAAGLARLAEAGSWRAGLEQRYSCAAPRPVIILGRFPARLLLCTQRLGGWPHVALAASVDGRAWFADGVQPAYPAMERAIGILGGAIAPGAARTASVAISDQLLADRLSEAAFTSGDIREFDALMRVGNSANQAEDYPAAVTAYRAALALQQKALGAENPNIAAPMMDLALNLSDQGNYRQADRLFTEAASLAPGAADATAVPRLLHYRGLDALNQGHPRRALSLLERAGRGYAALLPPALITPHRMTGPDSVMLGSDATEILTAQTMLLSPMSQQALLGVMETLRYRAVALAALGQSRAAGLLVRRASIIAANNGVAPPVLNARIDRIAATIDTAAGRNGEAADRLAEAGLGFAQALPGSRPVADTELLRGAVLARARRIPEALAACRRGAALLRRLRLGTSARLISPCLEALRIAAEQAPGSAHAVHAEMFGMAELAQGTTTSEEIAESAARLAADARNPRVAAAIRARQDAVMALARLYRARDDLAQGGAGKTSALTALDARIAAADARLSRTDETVEAAAPNFGQLVQESVPARSVLALLRPHEAFLDIMLAPDHAWLFLLHDKRIEVARTAIGELRMTSLVRAVRHSLEPSQAGLPRFAMKDAAVIYGATIGPFAGSLAHVSALVISPSGPLLSLPFALLPTRPARADDLAEAPWLIRRMTLVYVPAAANFVSLRRIEGDSRASQPWFGFGDFQRVTPQQADATFQGPSCALSARLFADLPDLPYAKLELAASRAIFHAPASDELLGADFTVPAIERADLAQYRVLHFATHALLPSELPCAKEAAIVTSPPPGARSADRAMLTTSDITDLRLNADLVVLSACNTGGSNGRDGGEALSGIARAFFFAGARALMVTQWAVNDQVSSYLVATTLQRLAADGQSAASLRAAQLALIEGAGHGMPANLADPFYWAPFVVIGDGGPSTQASAVN